MHENRRKRGGERHESLNLGNFSNIKTALGYSEVIVTIESTAATSYICKLISL